MNKGFKVGIDIGSKTIRVVAVEKTNSKEGDAERAHPRILAATAESADGIRHGKVISRAEALKSIKNAIRKTEKVLEEKIGTVFLSITTDTIKTKIFKTKNTVSKASNEVTNLDFEKARGVALNSLPIDSPYEVLNISASEVRLDGKKVRGNPIGCIGGILEISYLINLIPKTNIEDYIKIFEELDIDINEIIFGTIASSIALTKRRERISGIGILNIGHDNTSFILYENDMPIINKVYPIAGNNITNDIALVLQTRIEDAEKIKKDYKDLNAKKIAQIIEARIIDICELIKKDLSENNFFGKIPGGIILIGGTSKIEKVEEVIQKYLQTPIFIGNKTISERTENVLRDSSWASAFGLTYLEDKEENLLKTLFKKLRQKALMLLTFISP